MRTSNHSAQCIASAHTVDQGAQVGCERHDHWRAPGDPARWRLVQTPGPLGVRSGTARLQHARIAAAPSTLYRGGGPRDGRERSNETTGWVIL